MLFITIREESGLALSSRNVYLTDDERKSALSLNQSLKKASLLIKNGENNADIIINEIKKIITSVPYTRIDYIKIVDPETLEDIKTVNNKYAVLLAVYVGNTRLIDNFSELS